jgi:hypothetical protein
MTGDANSSTALEARMVELHRSLADRYPWLIYDQDDDGDTWPTAKVEMLGGCKSHELVACDHHPDCHYKDDSAILWNEWNVVWQCHGCGAQEVAVTEAEYLLLNDGSDA